MISMSNSILPSASSAPEPHGNGPEVLILCSLSRLSRALCPRAPSSRARLSLRAPRQDGDEDLGTWRCPGMGSRGVRRKSCKHTSHRARHRCSRHPCPHRLPERGFMSTAQPSQRWMPVLRGAAPVPIPRAILGSGEEAYPLGFSFFPGIEGELMGLRAQRQDSCAFPLLGEEQGSRGLRWHGEAEETQAGSWQRRAFPQRSEGSNL